MKKFYSTLFFLVLTITVTAQNNLSALIPMPNLCKEGTGKPFDLGKQTKVYVNDERLQFAATTLTKIIQQRTGVSLAVSLAPSSHKGIQLCITPGAKGEEEAYELKAGAEGIIISGATPGAVLYGVMTLGQILLGDICASGAKQVMPVTIKDAPRFKRRALMLDPARNFLPVEDVEFYMDQMMKYKYNVLQLHLTDDWGWRLEVKNQPVLTASGPYYTQDDLKRLVEYGAKRNIEIIPEIDIPGHTVAVLAVYPELGCTPTDSMEIVPGKTLDLMLCAAREPAYDLFKEIITQVGEIFPSQYIHLGGDEAVVDKNWAKCERCQAMMKEKGYTKASQLMIPFFEKMLRYVRDAGKQPILWCELNNIQLPADDYLFPYPKDAMLVSWRGGLTPLCLDLTFRHGNEILLAPGEYAYLDYPQLKGDLPEYNNWGMPVTTLKKVYEFDPGYGLPLEQQSHIAGVMGTLWGEAIQDINRVNYMTFPRALALTEAGWTQMEHRNWDSFRQRLYPNLLDLMKSGVSVRAPFEIVRE